MRILIIDDDVSTKCEWIKNILKQKGIKYEFATNFKDAQKKVRQKEIRQKKIMMKFDAIILDMQFPESPNTYKGKEIRMGEILLQELKNMNIEIPVLGYSVIKFVNSEEYSQFYGQIQGFTNRELTLKEFLHRIEEQSE